MQKQKQMELHIPDMTLYGSAEFLYCCIMSYLCIFNIKKKKMWYDFRLGWAHLSHCLIVGVLTSIPHL